MIYRFKKRVTKYILSNFAPKNARNQNKIDQNKDRVMGGGLTINIAGLAFVIQTF